MKAVLSMLALSIALGVPVTAGAAAAAQPLSINLHGDGARATQLPQYDPNAPVAVTVNDTSNHFADAVTVVAVGPAGESVQTELVHGTGGAFTGTLFLADQGSWRLHLTSRAGKVTTDTSPVLLEVQAPPPSNAWQIGLAVGTGIFVLVGGGGFLVLRRTVGATPDGTQARAA